MARNAPFNIGPNVSVKAGGNTLLTKLISGAKPEELAQFNAWLKPQLRLLPNMKAKELKAFYATAIKKLPGLKKFIVNGSEAMAGGGALATIPRTGVMASTVPLALPPRGGPLALRASGAMATMPTSGVMSSTVPLALRSQGGPLATMPRGASGPGVMASSVPLETIPKGAAEASGTGGALAKYTGGAAAATKAGFFTGSLKWLQEMAMPIMVGMTIASLAIDAYQASDIGGFKGREGAARGGIDAMGMGIMPEGGGFEPVQATADARFNEMLLPALREQAGMGQAALMNNMSPGMQMPTLNVASDDRVIGGGGGPSQADLIAMLQQAGG